MIPLTRVLFSQVGKSSLVAENGCQTHYNILKTQVRTRFIDWKMLRDYKKRQVFKEHAPERLRINALRKNNLLPKEIQAIADKEIQEMPKDSSIVRLHKRCVLTSRPRGNLRQYRMSRIMWRHFADYNKLSGVTRSSW